MAYPESGAPGMWEPDPATAFAYQANEAAPAMQAVAEWPPGTDSGPWPQWNAPPPALYPDHPSAPVPRVQVPGPPPSAGPGLPGQAMRGNPGYPSGPMAGPPQLPQRQPGASGGVRPRANGAGPRSGGPGRPQARRPLTQDFNTGDIYNTGEIYNTGDIYNTGQFNTGQFPPAPADYPSGAIAQPQAGGPAPRPGRQGRPGGPGGPGRANGFAGPNGPGRAGGPAPQRGGARRPNALPGPAGPAAPNGYAGPGAPGGPNGYAGPGGPRRPNALPGPAGPTAIDGFARPGARTGPNGFPTPGRPPAPNGPARPERPTRAGGPTRPNRPAPAGGPPRGPRASGPARANVPGQDYDTGQQFQAGPGYPAPDYNGQGFGAPQDYDTGQQFQAGPGYPPARGFDQGQGRAPARVSQPGPGYSRAGGTPSQQRQPRGPQDGGGNRRLYAVPSSPATGPGGVGPRGGQMARYNTGQMPQYNTGQMPQFGGQMPQFGGQAVALADPGWQDPGAWQGETQGALATMPAPAFAPPRPRTRPNGPAARPAGPGTAPARSARPNGLAGPRTTSARRSDVIRGRQARAMRIATAATISVFSIAVIAAGANIAHFGFKFFTFRETGAGETGPNGGTDQDFLAKEAAAAKAAAQGHTPGKHSAKSTAG